MRPHRLAARLARVLSLLIVSAVLAGCLWQGDAGPAAAIMAPPTADVAAGPAPSAAAADGSAYRQLESVVARIRGLEPTREVALRFMSQQELRRYFADAFDREYSPEERQRDQQLLVTLGLLEPGQDLTALMLDLLSEQVIGFYDEETREMYLIGDVVQPTAASKVTFAHEFTHALQDEYFDLRQLNPPDSDNDDRSAAIQALVEGDATLVMLLYMRNELSAAERREYARSQLAAGDADSLDRAPLVLREELLFPYQAGLRFVQVLERQGGFAAVDAAFRDPPQSTEQILHPEKYRAREAPVPVALPDLAAALGSGWRQSVSNTLGELDLRILIEQFTDGALAERAGAGWGGDRYVLLQSDDGRAAVVIKTVWDTPLDAQEFSDAYQQALRKRYGAAARSVLGDASRLVIAGDGFAASTVLRGQEVLIVLAPDEATRSTLAQVIEGG